MHELRTFARSRALTALLLFLLLVLPACGGTQSAQNEDQESDGQESSQVDPADATQSESTEAWTTVQAARPEDILSEEQRTGAPKYKDFFEEGSGEPIQLASGTSAGTIPAVKPFNFGRDPGGPEDKTLYLSVPKLGIEDLPIFDSIEEEKLKESAVHVPATGFPWQNGANVYIAGHRVGYPDTRSSYVFYDLDKLTSEDEISLVDADGEEYVYRVTEQKVVPPDNVEVMNAVKGKDIVTLQTCTLPDYVDRIVVQGELVEKPA